MRLEGKVAIITGGSLGIGLATAIRFAKEGAKVAIAGRSLTALEEAASLIRSDGGEVMTSQVDVQVKSQVDRLVDEVIEHWGAVHILVNNAGICGLSAFLDITEEDWDDHMNVNLKGSFLAGQRVAREMMERRTGGSIIHMSSVNGINAEAMQAHYNVTKGGMNLLSMSMALELAPYGIRVNALCPGFIETRLTKSLIDDPPAIADYVKTIPMGRVGQPEEIADAALFLASDESRYMTGHNLVVDGGQVIKLA
ncbi:SDR family NAD(P)-dependent oxidoreductase [Paenibacillus sp. V4I5]|uniref:SDR family NAD(P)-dependent oxidoreductase n=1 Tax=Paenibacillus sp. V4I5 TaxID=3042306 RepID=UPI00278ECAF3|nr:SDR family NAD(P)-dependent oxidoreductase [Paenibacillus sp. V4I5]MDQ0920227.1 NAD(P)-dependent dehydrogenase (short-subunit alcohol dehydrogenase family) [Paenibacillus sp. V4I5]